MEPVPVSSPEFDRAVAEVVHRMSPHDERAPRTPGDRLLRWIITGMVALIVWFSNSAWTETVQLRKDLRSDVDSHGRAILVNQETLKALLRDAARHDTELVRLSARQDSLHSFPPDSVFRSGEDR